tara:strand:- start:1696 stop:2127 length:432 start_codon:yes stop_codon:yes gene_type:complete
MSTLVTGTIQSNTAAPPLFKNSSGTEKGQLAKAWVNFDGTSSGTTKTIRSSFNVDSVTDLAVGRYRVNFTNSFSTNDSYSVSGTIGQSGTNGDHGVLMLMDGHEGGASEELILAGSVTVEVHRGTSSNEFMDKKNVHLSMFGS